MPSWPSISLSSGFTHVSDTQPEGAEEGETWYDLGDDQALVFDGANWHRMAVEDHSELTGISVGQHRSDSNVRATVDGAVDADTVDGQHAADLGAPDSTQTNGYYTQSGNASGGSGTNNGTVNISPTRPFADRWHMFEVSFSLEGDWNLGGYETLYFDKVEVLEQGSWTTLDSNIDDWEYEDTGGYTYLGSWSYRFDHSINPTVRLHFSWSGGDNISYRSNNESMTGAASMPHSHGI